MELALYYPFIIPSQNWMKQALLFFDGITSIVPEDYGYDPLPVSITNREYLPDLEWLQAEGLWHPTYVHDISSDLFERELEMAIVTLSHHPELREEVSRAPLLSTILRDKFADTVEDWLLDARIAQRRDGNLIVPDYALLAIMSVTAKWAAYDGRQGSLLNQPYDQRLLPNTDVPAYWRLVHEPLDGYLKQGDDRWNQRLTFVDRGNGLLSRNQCYELLLSGLLPYPGPDHSLDDVIQFRQAHNDELLAFRVAVNDMIARIRTSDQPLETAHDLRTRIESAVAEIKHAARSRRIRLGAAAVTILIGGGLALLAPQNTQSWMLDGLGTAAVVGLLTMATRGPASVQDMSYLVRAYEL